MKIRDFYNLGSGAVLGYIVIGEMGAALIAMLVVSVVGCIATEITELP